MSVVLLHLALHIEQTRVYWHVHNNGEASVWLPLMILC